ncbi:MAG: hypothetical protein JWL63_3065 [Rhodocyclales bacterium]|nr:hypothetical protein [Rhodocyclales bacterium]
MEKTAIGWLAWDLTHSATWVGTVALTDLIAALWVAPLAGAVTDRSNPYRLLWTTQTLMILLALTLWWLTASGHITIGLLIVTAIIDSTLQGFNQPVRSVVIATLAGPTRVSQAIATNSIGMNIARTTGPAVAGLVMVTGHISNVFWINAASFIAMLAAVLYVRRWIDHKGLAPRHKPLLGDISAGFSYVLRTPEIATLFLLTTAFALLARPFSELFPAFAGDVFKGGPQTLSMLMSAQGVGALFGATWMLRKRSPDALVRITFGAALGITLALMAFTSTRTLSIAVPAMALAGLLHVVCNIGMQSLAQTLAIPAMRGRVMALYSLIFRAGPSLGAFLIGLAAHWIGLQWLVGIAAFTFGALVMVCLPAARRVYAPRAAN